MPSWADKAWILTSEGMVETSERVEEETRGIWRLNRGTVARD